MIADHKGEIPFVVLLLPFLTGTGSGIYYPSAAFSLFPSVTLYSFAFAFILLNLVYRQLNLHKFRWLGGGLIHGLLFLLGWVVVVNYDELNNKDHFSKKQADFLLVKISSLPGFHLRCAVLR